MHKKNLIVSMRFAVKGIAAFFRSELHAVYHTLAAIAVIIAGFAFGVNRYEWAVLIIAITLVFISEIMNTAVEKMMDLLHPGRHEQAGLIKDLAAGFVLFSSFTAVILGIIVFYPYIL